MRILVVEDEREFAHLLRRGLTEEPDSVAAALAVDHDARQLARGLLPEIAAKAS